MIDPWEAMIYSDQESWLIVIKISIDSALSSWFKGIESWLIRIFNDWSWLKSWLIRIEAMIYSDQESWLIMIEMLIDSDLSSWFKGIESWLIRIYNDWLDLKSWLIVIEVLIDPDLSNDLFGSGGLIDRDWNFDWFGFVVLIERDWIWKVYQWDVYAGLL
jgi:hypothetical protein